MVAESSAARQGRVKKLAVFGTVANRVEHGVDRRSSAEISTDRFAQKLHGWSRVAAVGEIARPEIERLGIFADVKKRSDVVFAQPSPPLRFSACQALREQSVEDVGRQSAKILRCQSLVLLPRVTASAHALIGQACYHSRPFGAAVQSNKIERAIVPAEQHERHGTRTEQRIGRVKRNGLLALTGRFLEQPTIAEDITQCEAGFATVGALLHQL